MVRRSCEGWSFRGLCLFWGEHSCTGFNEVDTIKLIGLTQPKSFRDAD